MENILILTDGSDCSEKAEREGVELANRFQVEQVYALTVLEKFPQDNIPDPEEMGDEYLTERAFAEKSVKRVKDMARENGLQAGTFVIESESPVEAINEFLEEHDIELVVMGTHGRSGLKRLFLGSTTERLLRSTSTPVMAIPTNE